MSKKQVKEELEQDILLDTFSKAQSYYDENKTTIISVAIALIVVIGGSLGYYFYANAQEQEAQNVMTEATINYLNQNYEEALYGSETNFTVGFAEVIENYSITDAANLAKYYAAVSAYKLGNTEEALDYISSYNVPDGIMGVGPLSFHATLLAEVGNHEEAAEKFVEAAELNINESTTPYNYLKAANIYLETGDSARAEEYAQKIVDEFESSDQVVEAQQMLGRLAIAG